MEHVRPFSGFPGLDDVLAFLATTNDGDDNQHPAFQQSELYSSKVDAKIIDESLRKSEFRTFEDEKLFGYVERVVSWLNGSDKHFHYQLRRDNITEMRYKADGKFLKHTVRAAGALFGWGDFLLLLEAFFSYSPRRLLHIICRTFCRFLAIW